MDDICSSFKSGFRLGETLLPEDVPIVLDVVTLLCAIVLDVGVRFRAHSLLEIASRHLHTARAHSNTSVDAETAELSKWMPSDSGKYSVGVLESGPSGFGGPFVDIPGANLNTMRGEFSRL